VFLISIRRSFLGRSPATFKKLHKKTAGFPRRSGLKKKTMIIRTAKPEDAPQMLNLIQTLAVFENEPDAVEVTLADLLREGFGEKPSFFTFVAEHQNEIIGMAIYYYRFSTWKGKTIHLEDLIVQEKYRGIGAGMALYKAIIAQGKKDQVRRIEWNVLDWNQSAIDFYEKTGAKVLKDWRVVQMDEATISGFLQYE
jgi:GNAT superfamily N-acetyltransferase